MEEEKGTPKLKEKLLPDFYKFCGKVLEAYLNFGGKIPQLVSQISNKNTRRSQNSGPFLKLLVSNFSVIETVIENVGLHNKFEKLSPLLANIIVADLLFGGPTKKRQESLSYPVTSVMSMKEELEAEFSKQGGLEKCQERCYGMSPRWVFVNSLRASVDEVNNSLMENGYYLSNLMDKTYDCFLDTVKTLGPGQYLEDFHLPGLLALPSVSNVTKSQLFAEQKILLQDKASCLPPLVSGVVPGMTVVDACAAPGNKTILLANLLKGKGRLIAIDKDERRFSLLKQRLSDHGAKNVRCINTNFTDVPHEDLQGAQVVLVDPSCSNSGVDMHTDERSVSAERIRSLAWMQLKLLSHALSLPGVQAVVYSTCSVHIEENEGVVEAAMAKFGGRFELEDLGQHVKQWKHFGVQESPYGRKVLRTDPKVDLCHGFFVAKFVAKPEVEELHEWNEAKESQEEWNENGRWDSSEGAVKDHSCPDDFQDSVEHSKAKKKKKNKPKCDSVLDYTEDSGVNGVCYQNGESKKSKALEAMNVGHDSTSSELCENSDYNENSELKKIRKKKRKNALNESSEDVKLDNNTKTILTDNASEEQVIDADCTENKKSKKKKRKHLSEDDCIEIETVKEKKKRRKDVSVDGSFANEGNDENGNSCKIREEEMNIIEDELVMCGNTKAKKKKKNDLEEENGAVTNGIDCERKTKKKKKKDLHEDTFDANQVETEECVIVETKKDKKKKKKLREDASDPNESIIIEDDIVETKREKRKRRKNLEEIATDANEVVTIGDEIVETRKEKKKRKRDLEGIAFDANQTTNDTCGDISEKSIEKRKRKKDLQD